jgi:hypothetical protein
LRGLVRQARWIGQFAPRISFRLRSEIERLADIERLGDGKLSAAEITRMVGDTAERLGFRRPSYQQVRVLVREYRRRPKYASTAEVLVDVAFRLRPPDAVLGHISGVNTVRRSK